jgi:two-component system sensor histidine kinase PhcS
MAEPSTLETSEFHAAFRAQERRDRVKTGKIASALVVFLMPAGVTLDYFVYHRAPFDHLGFFLFLRLLCSVLAGALWYLHTTAFGERNSQWLGLPIAWLPAFFICWMIYATEGPISPYYAGLNLILLAVSVVVRWSLRESLLAVGGVLVMYSAVTLPKADASQVANIFNNYYFLALTGIIVITGNYFFNQLRFSEFARRYELDVSQRQLETSNKALSQKKEELESANTQLSQNKAELEHALVELRQTQDQLVTKEKQASLGVWSAGIIHEMNNPLNFARTGLYALRNKEKHLPTEQQPDFKDLVADLEDGIKRVHMIVSDLRTYAHPGKEDDQEEVPIEEALRVALRFFSADLQGRVEIIKRIPEGMLVYVNRNKLVQVLGNLLQNSIDALKLKKFPEGEHPIITISGTQSTVRSNITIRDNGTGIKKEDLSKIFDPFFTTKDVGQGMGLGLGICYRIVQGFGGTISVRSEPGEFCEFTLDLPAERPDAAAN